jgi:hypothetical protein
MATPLAGSRLSFDPRAIEILGVNIGGDDRDPVETDRLQLNPRMVRMPHSDAHSHPWRGQAVHQSPTEEAPSTEHHNHGQSFAPASRGPDNAHPSTLPSARIS